jgi:hypothetical protein
MKCYYCKREGIQSVMQDGRKIKLCQLHLDDWLEREYEAQQNE